MAFFPSRRRVFLLHYLYPLLIFSAVVAYLFYVGRPPSTGIEWFELSIPWIGHFLFWVFGNGFLGEKCIIRVFPDMILVGHSTFGENRPIIFDQIDFKRNNRKKGHIYDIRGNRTVMDTSLFDPEDVAEIWKVIDEFEKQAQQQPKKESETEP